MSGDGECNERLNRLQGNKVVTSNMVENALFKKSVRESLPRREPSSRKKDKAKWQEATGDKSSSREKERLAQRP